MTAFQTGALQLLGRVYRLIGGIQAPEQVDMVQPVTMVHDVSREVERGSSGVLEAQGFLTIGQDNVHGVGGTVSTAVPIQSIVESYTGLPWASDLAVWLIDFNATAQGANLTNAALSVFMAALGNSISPRDWLLAYYSAYTAIKNGGSYGYALMGTGGAAGYRAVPLLHAPLFLSPGSTLGWRTTTGAADVIRMQARVWVGARGTTPPGMP